jgi:hypothetical protein
LSDSDAISSSDSSSSSSSSSTSSSASETDVQLSFNTYNMAESDYHGISQYINSTFGRGVESQKGGDSGVVDTRVLTTIIVEPLAEYVGNTAKSEEDEFPLAFIGMVPFVFEGYFEEQRKCMKNISSILLDTARKSKNLSKKHLERVEGCLTYLDKTCLVMHDRFMNLPPDVGGPLYKQLVDDLPAAQEEDRAFDPESVLLIVPIFRELESQLDDHDGKKKRRKTEEETTDFQFYYAEDELLENITEIFWDFRIKTPHETPDSRRAFGDRGVDAARRVFLLSMEEFREFAQQCQSFSS